MHLLLMSEAKRWSKILDRFLRTNVFLKDVKKEFVNFYLACCLLNFSRDDWLPPKGCSHLQSNRNQLSLRLECTQSTTVFSAPLQLYVPIWQSSGKHELAGYLKKAGSAVSHLAPPTSSWLEDGGDGWSPSSLLNLEAENQIWEWQSRKKGRAGSLLTWNPLYLYFAESAVILCFLIFTANCNK